MQEPERERAIDMELSIKCSNGKSFKFSKELLSLPSDIFLFSDGTLFIRADKLFKGAIIENVTFDGTEMPDAVKIVVEEPNLYELTYVSNNGRTFSKDPVKD